MAEQLRGKDFVALRRLSTADDETLANIGETCERVPASKGGTVTDALLKLLASGKIEPAKKARQTSGVSDAGEGVIRTKR